MATIDLCRLCLEYGGGFCLRLRYLQQSGSSVGRGLEPDALVDCTQKIDQAKVMQTLPWQNGNPPRGTRHLSAESFLPEDERLLQGGANNLPPPDEVPDEEGV